MKEYKDRMATEILKKKNELENKLKSTVSLSEAIRVYFTDGTAEKIRNEYLESREK